VGKLADGSVVNYGNALSRKNELPVFVLLYAKKGLLAGPLLFDPTQAQTDASGAGMKWYKRANALDKLYPDGWPAAIGLDLVASKFVRHPAVSGLNALSIAGVTTPILNAVITLTDGLLFPSTSNAASISLSSKSTILGAPGGLVGAENLKLTIVPSTGALSGSFIHPGTGKAVPLSGVVYQKTYTASGFFLYFPPRPSVSLPAPKGVSGGVSVMQTR
jgi:hypothetical protein